MPLLSQNRVISNHKIEGIGDDFIPELVDKKTIDKVIVVNDDDAINMSRILAKELGMGIGISSGANFISSVIAEGNVVTIFADDNKKYLSTELSDEICDREDFISNNIKILKK